MTENVANASQQDESRFTSTIGISQPGLFSPLRFVLPLLFYWGEEDGQTILSLVLIIPSDFSLLALQVDLTFGIIIA